MQEGWRGIMDEEIKEKLFDKHASAQNQSTELQSSAHSEHRLRRVILLMELISRLSRFDNTAA